MAERMDGDTGFGEASALGGGAPGALDPGATHGEGRRRTVGVLPPGGRKEPGGVTRGFPGGTPQSQRLGGQGAVTVFRALPTVAMDLEARANDGRDLQEEGCMEPQSSAGDRGAGDLVVPGGGGLEEPPDRLHTEDGGETVYGWRTPERQGVPVALEDVLRAEAEATRAEAPGRWGEASDVFAVEAGVWQLLCGEEVGRCAVELSQQTDLTDRGLLGTLSLATELKRSDHVLTQWGHTIAPFMR